MAESRPPRASTSPLTERVLARLGRPTLLWILLWGLLGPLRPWINAGILLVVGDEAGARLVLERNVVAQGGLGYIIVLTLVGTRWLMQRSEEAEPTFERLGGDRLAPGQPVIRWMGSTAGPLLLAILIASLSKVSQLDIYPSVAIALDWVILVVALVPVATCLWAYLCIVIGLDRFGRLRLTLDPFPPDRGLGLRPLGSLAFVGVVVVAAADLPYLIILARSVLDVVIGVVIFGLVVALFLSALWRLHGQMVLAKEAYVEAAAALYAQAFEPMRASYELDTLAAHADRLSAADSLEKRAESILEWPVDERILGRLLLIGTGVVTAVISTFVLQQIGFR